MLFTNTGRYPSIAVFGQNIFKKEAPLKDGWQPIGRIQSMFFNPQTPALAWQGLGTSYLKTVDLLQMGMTREREELCTWLDSSEEKTVLILLGNKCYLVTGTLWEACTTELPSKGELRLFSDNVQWDVISVDKLTDDEARELGIPLDTFPTYELQWE